MAALVIAGCGDEDDSLPATTGTTPTTAASGPSGKVAAAIADLAGRIGVDESAITVVEEREVTWPDSSLGCPEPGVQYLQRLTNGVLVVLEAQGRRYEYHGGDTLAYCKNPTAPSAGD